ncbi:SDR family oxidoreductase [Nocardia transvalensis]|uniref:SDR family oxidoreductase n=1 Tax=Nocardia transvalensis TaxID=37333 RepID=UPI00189596FF|nr:SDR family oxidoreductase [Nocardia transvalensis]MBF6327438.1 SDR family oxidoreductase [Nocardia transvalensis]
MSKVWFITGVSRGFGREWALAALDRGDRVAGTARELSALDDLVTKYPDTFLPLRLDVTDRAGDFAAVEQAAQRFGRLDVVVNNAGYGQFGMIEELTEDEVRAQLETNVFGALWVTQAALPIMRAQGSGHIIQVSSIGGISAFPNLGAYHASKWALEGFSQSLAQEVAGFGIHVTLIEPGGFSTDWAGPSARHSAENPAYDEVREARNRVRSTQRRGEPTATRAAILAVVDADEPPLRIFLGETPLQTATADYESRLETWRKWHPIALAAQGD